MHILPCIAPCCLGHSEWGLLASVLIMLLSGAKVKLAFQRRATTVESSFRLNGDIYEQACQVVSRLLLRDDPNIYPARGGQVGITVVTCHAIQFGPAPVINAAFTSPCPSRGPAVPSRFRSSQSSQCPPVTLPAPFRFRRCPTPLRRARLHPFAAWRARARSVLRAT
jgi:hypothetical protein